MQEPGCQIGIWIWNTYYIISTFRLVAKCVTHNTMPHPYLFGIFFISSCFHSFSFVIIFTFVLKMFLVPQEWHNSAKECVLAVTKTIPPFSHFYFHFDRTWNNQSLNSLSPINLNFLNAIIFCLILPMKGSFRRAI